MRAERILQRQSQHPDGRLYADGEFPRFPPREQMAAYLLAGAFLLHWLDAHKQISPKTNWLAESDDSARKKEK